MAIRNLFSNRKKASEVLEKERAFPEGMVIKCPKCKKIHVTKELEANLKVCPKCQFHFTMTANERMETFVDAGSFEALDTNLQTINPLNFPAYIEKVQADMKKTGLNEAVLTGTAQLKGQSIVLAIMDSNFRMGSMGSVVGE